STRAVEMSTHAVSPVSIFGAVTGVAGAGPPGAGAVGALGAPWLHPRSATANTSDNDSKAIAIDRVDIVRRSLLNRRQANRRPLARALVALPGSDAHRRVHWSDEDLAVADVPGFGGPGEDAPHLVGQAVRHHDLDLDLRQEVHGVLAATVEFGVALLTPEP